MCPLLMNNFPAFVAKSYCPSVSSFLDSMDVSSSIEIVPEV